MSIRSRVTIATVVLAALAVGTVDVTTFLLLRRDMQRACGRERPERRADSGRGAEERRAR